MIQVGHFALNPPWDEFGGCVEYHLGLGRRAGCGGTSAVKKLAEGLVAVPLGSALTSRTQTRLNAFTTGVTSIEVTRALSICASNPRFWGAQTPRQLPGGA